MEKETRKYGAQGLNEEEEVGGPRAAERCDLVQRVLVVHEKDLRASTKKTLEMNIYNSFGGRGGGANLNQRLAGGIGAEDARDALADEHRRVRHRSDKFHSFRAN